eukprot:6196140-Pleurochrysis_carterae.AAC.1
MGGRAASHLADRFENFGTRANKVRGRRPDLKPLEVRVECREAKRQELGKERGVDAEPAHLRRTGRMRYEPIVSTVTSRKGGNRSVETFGGRGRTR